MKTVAPRVTVLMAVYNGERFLRSAVESILNQTFSDFELLIVDDASTDSTPKIIRSYKDPRIRMIRNSTNRGVSLSRKKALELAGGEYVAVLDADDVAFKDRLKTQVDYLDANPDIHLIGSACEVIDEFGNVEGTRIPPTNPLVIRWRLLFGNCLTHSTAMFRRVAALEAGGYDEQVFSGEDFDLWVRFAAQGKIAQLSQPLGQWRRHWESTAYTEPAEVKDHFIWTVVKSIRLQTNQCVTFDVATVLYGNIPKYTANRTVVLDAYATIVRSLERIQASAKISKSERQRLVFLALEDIFRIVKQNPSSYSQAYQAAVLCMVRHHLAGLFSKTFIRMILATFLPARVMNVLGRVSRLNPFRAFDFHV